MSTTETRLQRRGFQRIGLGGNCDGWAREIGAYASVARKGRYFCGFRGQGAATLVITTSDAPTAPESLTDAVAVVVYGDFGAEGERVLFEDTFPSLAYALRCMRLDA